MNTNQQPAKQAIWLQTCRINKWCDLLFAHLLFPSRLIVVYQTVQRVCEVLPSVHGRVINRPEQQHKSKMQTSIGRELIWLCVRRLDLLDNTIPRHRRLQQTWWWQYSWFFAYAKWAKKTKFVQQRTIASNITSFRKMFFTLHLSTKYTNYCDFSPTYLTNLCINQNQEIMPDKAG